MILHTLNASPASAACRDCLKVLGDGDALVLLGDGVYAALERNETFSALQESPAHIYILGVDAELAGVPVPAVGVTSIDMHELVTLTEQFPRQQAWY